jgi:hypothetical protein
MTHILLHFIIPAIIAGLFFRHNWRLAFLLMIATMVVDFDHLLATPFYDAGRCSIGFHPLHGLVPIALYGIICFIKKLRYVGVGLIIHMLLDSIDCQLNNGVWFV